MGTKNILIDDKDYKGWVIYFTRYIHRISMKMLVLHYPESIRKIKEHRGRKYLMVDDYMLYDVLDTVKEIICIDEFHDTKIFIDTYDELLDDSTLKNVVILITCVIKDGNKFYPKLFLEGALFLK